MNKNHTLSLFIFRRDLRLNDNTALIEALKTSKQVICCFIFDPRQIESQNTYRSSHALQFMLSSLTDLDAQLTTQSGKLYIFSGEAEKVVESLLQHNEIDAVYCNTDYTPFSITRDLVIQKICNKLKRRFFQYDDLLLHHPNMIKSKKGTPYTIFTPFYKQALLAPITKPEQNKYQNFYTKSVEAHTTMRAKLSDYNYMIIDNHPLINGGRAAGIKILKHAVQLRDYAQTHDYPAISTSHLSAHLKFGTISIRETYHTLTEALGKEHPFVRQLYWRDFYTHIAYHFPPVFGHAFNKKYDNLNWSKNKEQFMRWCAGTTGFPLVDAGMRELNATGFMHNRVRMIVASFLTKDLHINWQWGEKYFAQQLVDYDPAVNNGNWQWAASTGCDPQPYFRIFNPWLQQKKFDTECVYIKKWIPELRALTPKEIHAWFKATEPIKNYPPPIINHAREAELAKTYFK